MQSNIGFQGSRHKWQGAVYQQPLTTRIQVLGWREPSVQRRGMGQFVGKPEYAYGPSKVGGWAGRPETYRREELSEYSTPSLRRAEDYQSRQLIVPRVGRFGRLFSTKEHSAQQGSEDLDYAEYEEGTSPNAYVRAFEQIRRANGLADDLEIITVFSLVLLERMQCWFDYYLDDHPDYSWADLKRAFCKRYGGEPWQEQATMD
jgi:hypothetical protein